MPGSEFALSGGDLPSAPQGLDAEGQAAWSAFVRSMDPGVGVTPGQLLQLEAACKAWSRYRALEAQLDRLRSDKNPVGGELTKSPTNGRLEVSALRRAATSALAEFRQLSADFIDPDVDSGAEPPNRDIFGYPDRPGRGQKGRPKFQATAKDRNRVRLLLATGWSNKRIAAALEISEPTLRRAFKRELGERDVMRDRLDARRMEIAMQEAGRGNVAALRELGKLLEAQDLRLAEAHAGRAPDAEPEAKPERLGKKEQNEQAAADAEEWLTAEIEAEAGRAKRPH
ncbi:helix-turn-helix domain-containing protein [Maritimibacter alexandrii]|uniref:helix-turn-helix domain-containing protein n=1 Tax=Maritimibacter alexandrii TaxID=2570355 RepID=UPI001BB1227C|nr:helix-turn-helix domain-containing protein [Maritimibacter alexandrii]